jgi:UDP:flavonoid glycosyltransferase YjiC (YdhE family)
VVVSDFRLSMAIAAELCEVPHVALSNVHWSPHARLRVPVPEHPLVRIIGVGAMRMLLRVVLPLFWKVQLPGFNRLCKTLGLRCSETVQDMFTRGTRTGYLDVPELYDIGPLPPTHHYLGPALWTPPAAMPAWWDRVGSDRPLVFFTPGSSGDLTTVREIVEALSAMGTEVMLATAGRLESDSWPEGVHVADFIPAGPAAERAALVICNGGSAMVYHALAAGTPALGVPLNIDQYYTMEALTKTGAGSYVRSGSLSAERVRTAAEKLLADPEPTRAARSLQASIRSHDPVGRLAGVVRELTGTVRDGPAADEPAGAPAAEVDREAPSVGVAAAAARLPAAVEP